MNLREGTRRLALFLGAVGAILGGFASYVELQAVLDQRAHHDRFEQLANSDAARQEQKSWSLTLRYTPDSAIEILRKLPEAQQRAVLRTLTQDERADLMARLNCAPSLPGATAVSKALGNLHVPDGYTLDAPETSVYMRGDPSTAPDIASQWKSLDQERRARLLAKMTPDQKKKLRAMLEAPAGYTLDSKACVARPIDPPASTVNKSGVRTVHWSNTLAVESIETADGQTLYPAPSPPAWIYLLVALFPVLGFFIPWGAIRAIGWVGAGFVKPAN